MTQAMFHHKYRDSISMLAAGGTPVAQKAYGPVPQGYEWEIQVVAFAVLGGAHNAIFDLAIGPDNGNVPALAAWDFAGLVWTSQTAQARNTENTGPPFWMDAGDYAHAVASGGSLAAGDVVTVTFQIAAHEKDPIYGLLTPEERREVAAAHQEHGMGHVTESAVAGERAV